MTDPKKAILAGGCFWGMQDLIRKQPGVVSTQPTEGQGAAIVGGEAAGAVGQFQVAGELRPRPRGRERHRILRHLAH